MRSAFLRFFFSPIHHTKHVAVVWLLLSYCLLSVNSGWGFFGLILAPDFLPAFLFTVLIAALLTIYIHEATFRLQRKYHFKQHKQKRLIAQFFAGVLVPVVFEIFVASLFFAWKGTSIFSTSYFDADFILIVVFIVCTNAFYIYAINVYLFKRKIKTRLRTQIEPALDELIILKKIYRLRKMRAAPLRILETNLDDLGINKKQIACAYKIDHVIRIHYFDNSIKVSKKPIAWHFAPLPKEDYFQINPYCFYHRLLIFQWQDFEKSRRTRLILRHPFNALQHDQQRIVSQSNSKAFRVWFAQKDDV